MKPRLLVVNCPSEYFVYIPMGTFGLCDYLSRKGIETKILNLALYSKARADKVLNRHLKSFQPTHIGLIFHWQDTAEGFLWAGEYIRSQMGDVKIICGGFTGGYFGEDVLKKCKFLDCIIKGDPEKPLELLFNGADQTKIPNLIYRSSSGVVSNKVSFFIDGETLSSISFSDLTHLCDYDLYMDAVNKKLGFPVFIGRGCLFNCDYCGGSCSSFRLHNARTKPAVRSVESVIEDLKRLKAFTKKIYLCYENDRDYIKALFREIGKEKTLMKTFQLNYGAWHLFDREFLEMYKDLFIFPAENRPVFELSPEVFDDRARKKIKHKTAFSVNDLKENLSLINDCLGDCINISVFFSRYHDAIRKYPDMKNEITGIFSLKHTLLLDDVRNVHITYGHLSTDVASRYWEKYVERCQGFDTLLSAIRKVRAHERYSFPFDNLCVYMPETLTENEVLRCELTIVILKVLEKYFYEMFHILFEHLDGLLIGVIEEIVIETYLKKPVSVFKSLDHRRLLVQIMQKIIKDKSLLSSIPFIEDLTSLNIKKAEIQKRCKSPKSRHLKSHSELKREFISVHDHDYLDLKHFLTRTKREGPGNLICEKTFYIFLADEILSMPAETFELTLKEFEKGISIDEYYELMKKKVIFTPSYHKDLIGKLVRSRVLV